MPKGIVYAPAPVPVSALFWWADGIVSLTWMRRILPRRSLVLSVERRSSPVGRWNQPPSWAVAIASAGVLVPVRPEVLAVSWLTFFSWKVRRKNTFRFAV